MQKKVSIASTAVVILGLVVVSAGIRFDHREVKLRRVGTATMTPTCPVWQNTFIVRQGIDIKMFVERDMFASVLPDYTVDWADFSADTNKVYYVGVGCEIGAINYLWHTKFFRPTKEKTKYRCFRGVKSVRIPAGTNTLTLYEGDVLAIGP